MVEDALTDDPDFETSALTVVVVVVVEDDVVDEGDAASFVTCAFQFRTMSLASLETSLSA